MNVLFLAKLAAGGLFSIGTISFGTFVANPNLFGYYGSVYVFAKTHESTDNNAASSTANAEGFKCKFSKTNEEFDCKISVPTIETNKNTDISTLKKDSLQTVDIKSKDKIVKIKLSQKIKDWEHKVLSNDVVVVSGPKDSIDTSKKIILKPLFTASSARKTIGKTKFFVAQAGSDLAIPTTTNDATTKPKHTYEGTGWNLADTTEIEIFNFSDQETDPKPKSFHKGLPFKKTIPEAIKKNKHYLIKCEERDLSIWNIQTSSFLHYKHEGDQKKQVTFRNIKPVIYDEEGEQVFTPIGSH